MIPRGLIPQGNDSPGGRFPRGVSPRGVIPLGNYPPGGRFPRGKDPPGPSGQGRGSRIPAVVGSNPAPPPPPLGPKSDRGGHECCEADFGSRIKILGHPLGQSASFFEIYLLRRGGKSNPPRQAGRQTKSTPQGKPQEEEKIDPPGHAGRQTEPTPPGKVWGGD